ncbi:ERF family protein [Kitasatospora sp. NPDC004745]|uniref:ERF family protein n=1 Tax=Kitasatospora sp. NPDC004745 TaxID=3364019 RepID=UPI0036D05018
MTQPTLAERAAEKAGRDETTPPQADDTAAPVVDVIPDLGAYEPREGDPEMVPVHIAWLRARRDVRAISKGEQYNGGGTRFNFRGVDTTVNTFGPVTLSHGLNLLPLKVEATYRDATSANNKKMHECTVLVTWQLMGPAGDSLPPVQSAGEALDSADKATAKAQSVALRVILLTLGLTPTSDPDPDSSHMERGEAPVRPAAAYLDEITNPATSVGRLRQIHHELQQGRQAQTLVTNEVGDEEPIGAMVVRIGKERTSG